MIDGLVTGRAQEILPSHMNIELLRGINQAFVQVAMFDIVPAAPIEMTLPTVFSRWYRNTFRGCNQINVVRWVAINTFAVQIWISVTDQTIHVFGVRKIVRAV